MKKERLDKLLVARGLVESRTKAQALVLAGRVFHGEERLEKPGQLVALDSDLTLRSTLPFVGRGGLKLQAALDHFQVQVTNKRCLDIGASTGGFTDCLLQRGAARVVAVDVGYGQLDWKLRQDSRVEVREKVNARYLDASDFEERFDLIVADVSFISLTKIFPVMPPLAAEGAKAIVLIKPQFELGRDKVGKGGIVRDRDASQKIVHEIVNFAKTVGMSNCGTIESPILGADGNQEFLACFDFVL